MAINSKAGVLLRPLEFKQLGQDNHCTAKVGSKVRFYRHPMQPGCFIVERPGLWFAVLPAIDVPTHIEEAH